MRGDGGRPRDLYYKCHYYGPRETRESDTKTRATAVVPPGLHGAAGERRRYAGHRGQHSTRLVRIGATMWEETFRRYTPAAIVYAYPNTYTTVIHIIYIIFIYTYTAVNNNVCIYIYIYIHTVAAMVIIIIIIAL